MPVSQRRAHVARVARKRLPKRVLAEAAELLTIEAQAERPKPRNVTPSQQSKREQPIRLVKATPKGAMIVGANSSEQGQLAPRVSGMGMYPGEPSVIDLFAGGGGLSLGLEWAGFKSSLAVDVWEPALSTHERNFPGVPVLGVDAGELSGQDLLAKAGLSAPPSVVAGGPPCQGFSSAGARRDQDRRNTLVGEFARLVAEVRAPAFIFENVEGFLTAADGEFVLALLDPLVEAGYWIRVQKLNVANYGVPQLRKRVIALGFLGSEPSLPATTHRAKGAPGVHRVGSPQLPPTATLMEALRGLPSPAADSPGEPIDHFARPLAGLDLERVEYLEQGKTMRDLPERLRHPSYSRRANRRVADGMPTERRGGAPAGIRRLRADEPSKAITSAAPREFVHPVEPRLLTLRECARLQTFPDDFVFLGNNSEKATLIGNAVPPKFAEALGVTVAHNLRVVGNAKMERPGRLLSFVPTNGSGMSPALAHTTRRVQERYGSVKQGDLGI